MSTVDVIIPTRNRYDLTAAAIGSVIGQTWQDWHLLVVDDSSDDGSAEQLAIACSRDPRITLIRRTERGGASAAREDGFRAGQAPWIALLDSDDLWLPHKLEAQFDRAGEADVVLAWHSWVRPDGTHRVTRKPTGRGRVSPLLSNNVDVLLARRTLVQRVGSFAGDTHTPVAADENIDFFIRLLAAANVSIVPEVLALCRDHTGRRTSDAMTPESLRQILDARRPLLEPWPDDLAGLCCRVAARYMGVGMAPESYRFFREGLAMASWGARSHLAREYAPFVTRQMLGRAVRR